MRVISGSARGMKLKSVEGLNTRPTSDRVKEALFSIIQGSIIDSNVLDLFSGTGALGIEALSRGADRCTFVDNSNEANGIIKLNSQKTKLLDKSKIIKEDVYRFLNKTGEKYDIIFMDPPYNKKIVIKVLEIISINDIIDDESIIVCEQSRKDELIDRCKNLVLYKNKVYGNTVLAIYKKEV